MGRRWYHYPVPETPERLMFEVAKHLPNVEWSILPAFVLAVADDTAAIYLRLRFSERPLGLGGAEVLDPHEVWMEAEEREQAERLLREQCPTPVAWFHILRVAFADEAEHRAFAKTYSDLTGIPHALAGGPDPGGIDTRAALRTV